jgi:hypothetical protein
MLVIISGEFVIEKYNLFKTMKKIFDTTNLNTTARREKCDKVAAHTEHQLLSAENRKLIPRLDKCLIVVGTISEIIIITVKLNMDF